jgi:hypothetical protein
MRVIQTTADVGEDWVLRVELPEDAPTGPVEVLVVIEAREPTPPVWRSRAEMTAEERRAVAEAGAGALRGMGISVEEFLEERREDDRRRDKALGL